MWKFMHKIIALISIFLGALACVPEEEHLEEEKKPETETPAPKPEPAPEPEPPAAAEPVEQGVIGNKNSKKYHEIGCGSIADMKESNKIKIESAEAALAKGYEPCQRCH